MILTELLIERCVKQKFRPLLLILLFSVFVFIGASHNEAGAHEQDSCLVCACLSSSPDDLVKLTDANVVPAPDWSKFACIVQQQNVSISAASLLPGARAPPLL